VSKGSDEIIREEIDREVQTLDRKSTGEKADYFLRRLGIGWFGGTIVPLLDMVVGLRNQMLHENPERMPTDTEMALLGLVTMGVPVATVAQAAILYPTAFSLPKNMSEEDARKFLPEKAHADPAPAKAE
jgi:hypothetical protein